MQRFGFGVIALCLTASAAFADRAHLLFQSENWVVEGVTSDDHSYSCRARISVPGDSFSIRQMPDQIIRLEFKSDEWDFGEGETASLEVAVDALSPWSFTEATLLQSSVFVDLYDLDQGKTFVRQIAKGKLLSLRTITGTQVRSYSLTGSSDAITKLEECDKLPVPDRNPFN